MSFEEITTIPKVSYLLGVDYLNTHPTIVDVTLLPG